jgi:erythronate-4-phosphate dehydrogenase
MIAIVDNAIPYIKGILEPFLDVIYAPGEAFSSAIEKAGNQEKCLFIRTRTKCDKSLLEGHKVRFIASATIGKDHIDEDYCRANSICVANAPGCNSSAVMQYFLTAISQTGILPESRKDREKLTVGIIGAGNVGEKVARLCLALGFRVMRNDPPKQAQGIPMEYFSLEEVLENSDIVTIHTPLDSTTRGLAGKHFFSAIKKGAHLVNASRGPVVDDNALLQSKKLGLFICDVWNNEPDINKDILQRSALATPHIAGYSVEGKQNATDAVVRAVAAYFNIAELKDFTCRKADERHHLDLSGNLKEQLLSFFPIGETDILLRESPEKFETIRKQYIYRHEFDY